MPESSIITGMTIFKAFAEGAGVALIRTLFDAKSLTAIRTIYANIFGAKRSAADIVGDWEGIFTQKIRKESRSSIFIQFTTPKRKDKDLAIGVGIYWPENKKPNEKNITALKFTGIYQEDRFLRLDFRNLDIDVLQFGTIIARLSHDRQTIANTAGGKGVAYWSSVGKKSGRIVQGTIFLKRSDEDTPIKLLAKFQP